MLLGKPASEAFAYLCDIDATFADMLKQQGVTVAFGDVSVLRFVLPHPTAPYPGKSDLYGAVFCQIGQVLANCHLMEKGEGMIGVGKASCLASPPSEPCVRFSRTRLSSRWSYLRED